VDRPEVALPQLAFLLTSRLDRRLVHGQHPALPDVLALRGVDRRQQVDGATRPDRETPTAHLDAGGAQALVLALAVEGQVVGRW
jgi:hypothetical protein